MNMKPISSMESYDEFAAAYAEMAKQPGKAGEYVMAAWVLEAKAAPWPVVEQPSNLEISKMSALDVLKFALNKNALEGHWIKASQIAFLMAQARIKAIGIHGA